MSMGVRSVGGRYWESGVAIITSLGRGGSLKGDLSITHVIRVSGVKGR